MAPKPPTSKPKSSGPKSSGPKSSGPKSSGPKSSGPKSSSSAAAKKPKSKAVAHRKPSTHTPLGVTKAVPAHKRGQRPLNEHEVRELEKSLPVLNTVVPVSAAARRGKAGGRGKKGKTFIDDHDKNTLLRMVEKAAMGKEGEVESKLEKAVSTYPTGVDGWRYCRARANGDGVNRDG
ncbi:hypothetical protein EX30DRAFT_145956 [Ascodesmis nigricans]|uniref:Uncharacterized protein n=1 Tax=Ascodesmis nigricans TaxID=341454 RepID=A0A4S2N1I0_9PEZI|nr:hypothetical protein EX30DRAFT_145956 [Ascodesmis nigricans]